MRDLLQALVLEAGYQAQAPAGQGRREYFVRLFGPFALDTLRRIDGRR